MSQMNSELSDINKKVKQMTSELFVRAQPFPHIVIDNFLVEKIAEKIYADFPSHEEKFWYKYDNPIEIKLACNVPEHMPYSVKTLLETLNSETYLRFFSQLTGIKNLLADPTMHGGGMHCIKSGGKLDVHIDYSIHPHLLLERRLNLLIYFNKNWKEEYGGELELWEKDMSKCAKKILPLFNRAVLFETDDNSYHGHPEPLKCPENMSRKSLALYFLTKPRKKTTERYRALFVARPDEEYNEELEKFRTLRSGLNTAKDLYRKKIV